VDRPPAEVTSLLNQLAEGDQEAAAKLVPAVYEELRRLATRRLRHERPGHTLQATALVREALYEACGQRKGGARTGRSFSLSHPVGCTEFWSIR